MRRPALVDSTLWRIKAAWARLGARRSTRAALRQARPKRVLVVCYGNIYRSPFAAERLRSLIPDLDVRSAGFHRTEGRPVPDRQVLAARRYAVDLTRHSSRAISPSDREWADIVVLMDRANWVRLRKYGFDSRRLVWLGALQPGRVEIDDPYSADDETAAALMMRMAECVDTLASALREPAA